VLIVKVKTDLEDLTLVTLAVVCLYAGNACSFGRPIHKIPDPFTIRFSLRSSDGQCGWDRRQSGY
jgi:hypothetical protein